ncbi:hypothetical protein [Chryseobacterium sp. SIMBA_038]|uniref:hypothetical protein n=1 Tax=Chryseobacterium sp. SIMBA_038 TaxID=3085780 RepID=UPI003979DC37
MVRSFFLMIILIFFSGCGNQKIEENYFIGKWKSNDGASFILKQDGTCILKSLNYYVISSFPRNENQKLNCEGIWKMVTDAESGLIDGIDKGIKITYHAPGNQRDGSITFYISGEGALGSKKPLSLFIWDGDPDEMKRYTFIKEQ